MDIFPRKTVRPFEPFAPKFDRASTVSLAYSNAMVLVCIVVFKKIALCSHSTSGKPLWEDTKVLCSLFQQVTKLTDFILFLYDSASDIEWKISVHIFFRDFKSKIAVFEN